MILRNQIQISQNKGKKKCLLDMSVFSAKIQVSQHLLINYFNFKKEFLFNNGRILEINDYYNRSRGNVSFTEISEIIIYQIENLLGWVNID